MLQRYKPLLLLIIIALICNADYVGAQVDKEQRYNRFQYHKVKWRALHTKAFHIYFPMYADSLCSFTARAFPDAQAVVKKRMLSGMDKVPNIIIYPSIDQFYESNIGSFEPEQYTLPTFVVKGNRLVLSFNGSYIDLNDQLRESIARHTWEKKIKEDGVEGQAKGVTINEAIPDWFKEGSIRYFAHGWPVQAEDAFKLSFKQNDFKDWHQVISYQPRLSGQALCYFLSKQYFKMAPAQVFVQLKKKNLQHSIRLLTKKDLNTLYAQCFEYYKERFQQEGKDSKRKPTIIIPLEEGLVRAIVLSPDERIIAYTATAKGKRTVYVYNTQSRITTKVCSYSLPPWLTDHSKDMYPMLQWTGNSMELQVAMPVKGKVTIFRYTSTGSLIESNKLYGIDGIGSFSSIFDREYLLGAYRRGQSDIVTYNDRREKYTPLTNDIYEDAYPVLKGSELYFISNRPKDSVDKSKKELPKLWQGVYTIKDKKIEPVAVDTLEFINWNKLQQLKDGKMLAGYTASGTEKITTVDVNGNVKELSGTTPFQYNKETDNIVFYKTTKDSIELTTRSFKEWSAKSDNPEATPWLTDYLKRKQEEAAEDSILKVARSNNASILDDVFAIANAKDTSKKGNKKKEETSEYDAKKVKPYILQLHGAYFSAKVNNDYFSNRYQPYQNFQGQFKFPEIGGMAQGGFTDLFENHHISVAYRLPAGSEGSNFFISYLNTKKKTDWGLSYYRNVESLKPDPARYWVNAEGKPYPNLAKVKTHYYEVSAHYPLTYDMSLGLQEAFRTDQTIFQATDRYSLEFNDIKSAWSITTVSYNVNKLKPTIPFLYKGFRGKVLIDVFKGFSFDESALFGSTLQAEYHQPLHKYITLVAQGRVGYSGGDKNLLYIFGGTDNNLAPKTDSTVQFAQSAPYAFQTLITPFRGYLQNTIYGNQYALFNMDVYFPIFETLIPIETPLPSINHLQIGIFSDAASAKETWKGATNTKGKWVVSYGLSARTMLAGYPLRLEVAWPGTFATKPVWYFSLNLR